MNLDLKQSIEKLGDAFSRLPWDFREQKTAHGTELVSQWLGGPDEDIMVCVFRGSEIHEQFHRQDFFFINYAYTGDYGAQSSRFDNHITIREDSCYLGQPFSGYALYGASDRDIVIIGILIRKEFFYRNFLPAVSVDRRLLHFFLDPERNSFSDEYIHLEKMKDVGIRALIELMTVEYASRRADTQEILKPMTEVLVMMLSRQYRAAFPAPKNGGTEERMIRYMDEHLDHVTLAMLSTEFGYHPTYISSRLSKTMGETFSHILLTLRMKRAALLIQSTDLTIEEIAPMVGYGDKSNFYRAFRKYYGKTPRAFLRENRGDTDL